jgi:subfamily B ATP-binding cassette protein MsbA
VLWFGGNIVLRGGELSAPNFIAFMVVFSQLIPPAKSFSSAVYEIKKGMASYERIEMIMNEPSVDLAADSKNISTFSKEIRFENVSFRYANSDSNAIDAFSFRFEKGKKYALVGASGAGKSTVLDLILGFSSPQQGGITIDETPIKSISLESYRRLFGLVTQEAILFNYRVEENIGFEKINKDKINTALEIGNAKMFSDKIHNQTIGERGSKLSGGEKQRLTIARVAYRNPEIVLMDEATSALDSQNEHEVQKAMDNLLQNKTSIIIAHRLSTIKNSDCIILMKEGKIIHSGSHDELYASEPIYKNMVDLQSFG